MSEIASPFKKHKRQPNMLFQNRMSLEKGKNLGTYEILDLIKEGSSSKVYLGKSKYTKELVAIKAINKSPLRNNLDDLLLITKQMETLKILKHRNIVTLYEIYESKKYIFLITEYLGGKDLIEKLIRKKRFNEEEALRIFFQLLDALMYMHKMNICHRNLRAEHILFDKNNRPKIVGFGYSSFYESNKTIEGAYGSLCYACPEIIDEVPYNPELADVWSLGVILYVLICGYLPFSDEDDNKNKILISTGKIDFPKEISNKLKDLLRHMLEQNSSKRYTFEKVLKHPWIKPYSEKILSQGINLYKIKFPVDERILNIINEYGLDKNKVKNDLIMNKYNVGTGVYKQIVRKLLDLKIKNISDLWSEEFVAYRDDAKNKYENGDRKYEEFIEKIDEKYRKKEDFVNDFKEREDKVAERLIYLQQKKEENKEKLNTIEESVVDDADEEIKKVKTNKIDDENNQKYKADINQNNIKTVKTQQKQNKKPKLFPRTKTPMFNFGELMKARRANNTNTNSNINSNNNNILNSENVQIIYNKDQDVDIIQQFQEEQNKKLSENIIIENPTHKKIPSTPDFGKGDDYKPSVVSETNPFKLSITPEKSQNIAKKILNQDQNHQTGKNTSQNTNSINKNSIYSNINFNNSLYSIINTGNDNNINNNIFKNLVSGNTIYTLNSNSNNNTKSLFRMTVARKSSNKSYLTRGSLYDDFLKKNHPDNIRKTILNSKSKFNNASNLNNNINEGIKEKDESESENENEKNEEKEKEKIANDKELKKSLKLKYSLSFDDDDEDENEEENEDDILNNKEEDEKLFKLLDNENDEELAELKKIYFSEDLTEKEKEKEKEKKVEEKKPKSIMKKKSVRFNDENIDKEIPNSPDSNLKKSIMSKLTINSNRSILEGLDKYEEKLKEINKNYQITNDKEDEGNTNIRYDSQLEISFHDDEEKFRVHYYDNYSSYNNDKDTIKKLNINKDLGFSIDNIYGLIKKNFLLKITKNEPCKKLNLFNHKDEKESGDIDSINKIFLKKKKSENEDNKQNGKLSYDNNDREVNGILNGEEAKPKDIINSRKEKKKLTLEPTKSNSKYNNRVTRNKKNSIDKNIIIKKDESTQINSEEFHLFKNLKIINQESFTFPDINDEYYSSFYNNGNNTYNGNYPIDTNKSNIYNGNTYDPNTVNYDILINKNNGNQDTENKDINQIRFNQTSSEFYNSNKDNKISKALKNYYYQNEFKNPQTTKNINIEKYMEPASDNKKINKFTANKQLQKFKSHYKKYEDMTNNLFSAEDPNYTKTLSRKKAGYNSVKDIKDEVIVKRNEIIEKIQHCQNLLDTIIKEKKHFTSNNKNAVNKKLSPIYKTKKKYNNDNAENLNKKIKQVYIRNKKGPKLPKNYTYKRINVKLNDKDKQNTYSFDQIDKDKANNVISLPENYYKEKNYTMRTCLKKDVDNKNNNNFSLDQNKILNNINESKIGSPGKKLIRIYQKYEDDNISSSNANNKKMTYNQTYSYGYLHKNYIK